MNLLFHSLYELGVRQGFRDMTNSLDAWTLDVVTGELKESKDQIEVPTRIGGRGNTGASNFLYDTGKYVLDYASTFWTYTTEVLKESGDKEAIKAVEAFLASPPSFGDAPFGKVKKGAENGPWVILTLKGKPICNRPKLLEAYAAKREADMEDGVPGVCLITGQAGSIVRLHPAIKFGADDKGGDAKLVSVNESSMEHFGTTQGFNYPISGKAARYYASALNQQLKSFAAFLTQDCAIVMWPNEGTEHPIIPVAKYLVGAYIKDTDAPQVKAMWAVVKKHLKDEAVLHIASLHKKQMRIVVRDYSTITVGELCANLWRFHMEFRTSKVVSLRRIIPHSTRKGDVSLTDPNFLDAAWAILMGNPFPISMTLLVNNQYVRKGNYGPRVINWIKVIHARKQPNFKAAPLDMSIDNDPPETEEQDSSSEVEDEDLNPVETVAQQPWINYLEEVNKFVNPDEAANILYTYGRVVALRMMIEVYYHAKRKKFVVPNLLAKTLQNARRPKSYLGSTRFTVYCNENNRAVQHHKELFTDFSQHMSQVGVRLNDAQNFDVVRGFFDQQRGYDERSQRIRKAKKEPSKVKKAS